MIAIIKLSRLKQSAFLLGKILAQIEVDRLTESKVLTAQDEMAQVILKA
jgi:pyridoxal biosynthesis lyase PdxS